MNENGTPNGETAEVLGQVKNDALDANKLANELAEARKIAEQAQMRARQLENEKANREKADEELRKKQLEENEEFKILYEREKTQREELEKQREQEANDKALKEAKESIVKDYSSEVLEIAEATGLSIYDDSDEAKAEFKSKLDVIASKFGNTQSVKVSGNNNPEYADKEDNSLIKLRFSDPAIVRQARKEAISKIPALGDMRKAAGIE